MRLGSQAGLTLIEVLIAALLVALISLGTFSAFTVAGRSSADTRAHAQAAQLAGQDEERLRALTPTELAQLGSVTTSRAENGDCVEEEAGKWKYWTKGPTDFCEKPTGLAHEPEPYTATVFTVTSSASYVSAASGTTKTSASCEAGGVATGYLQTTSSVTWPSLGTRPPVRQSSIVNVPGLLVKVLNQRNEPVSGATVKVSGIEPEQTKTTTTSGCVVFTGIPSNTTSVKVAATKSGWVNEYGEEAPSARTVPVPQNVIAETKFVIAEPGAIYVEFLEAGGTHAPVKGTTFYAFQTQIATPDGFLIGKEKEFVSDLESKKIFFPFRKVTETPPGEDPYTVFAGECEANNPVTVNSKLKDSIAQVEAGSVVAAKVYLPKFNITVYEGTSSSSSKLSSANATHVMIVNKGCESTTSKKTLARSSSGSGKSEEVPYKEEVSLEPSGGHLQYPFQPYAKELELCIVMHKGSEYYKYEETLKNENETESAYSIYMESSTNQTSTTALTCP